MTALTALLFCDLSAGCRISGLPSPPATVKANATGITDIAIDHNPLRTGVRRMGINLSGQTFYDSGQMLRNVTFRNPGFEGETWQSILRCKWVTATTCTDANEYAVWPKDFLEGASFEYISGSQRGAAGTVQSSSTAGGGRGIMLELRGPAKGPAVGDSIEVHAAKPGNAQAGWWTSASGGASFATEFSDLPPGSEGRQALRVNASSSGQHATLSSFFDSFAGRSFLQLRGKYVLRFRAKAAGNGNAISVRVERLDQKHGVHTFLSKQVTLGTAWREYVYEFSATEDGSALGTVGLTFELSNSSALLDEVSLTANAAPDNPTAFRDEVVQTLRDLRPGTLRYMDNGSNFGSSLDNMLTPPFARLRTGSSTQESVRDDIPIGLHEFLTLARAIGADPWYTMPAGTSPTEAAHLIEYLAGSTNTAYGQRRARLGQQTPWTNVFHTIHLELGNEQWNARSFAGAAIDDPKSYGERGAEIFAAMRQSSSFAPQSFDLILGSWATVPWWTGEEMRWSSGYDSIAVAPYLFTEFKDASSLENTFGPMFAQPQLIDSSPDGYMAKQADAVRSAKHPAALVVYETNLGTMGGTANQAQIDQAVPSLGAGLALAEHLLLMLRDLGINTQCVFGLPEYSNNFNAASGAKQSIPLWGTVVDMGGATNLRRPQFLAEQMVNEAILTDMLVTTHSGPAHAWNQSKSENDSIKLDGAQALLSFAFAEGDRRSLIVMNLSRTAMFPVTFSGADKPTGQVTESRLTAARITDSNENGEHVVIHRNLISSFASAKPYDLPPYSMTVLRWRTAPGH